MSVAEQTPTANFLGNYLRCLGQPRYLWVHVLLAGVSLVVGFYSTDTRWGRITVALAEYVFLVAFGLCAWIGWIMLRRADQILLLPSVAFITACWGSALTLVILATPSPLHPYWWLGLLCPVVGFPSLFVFFKLLRVVFHTRSRVQRALSRSRR